MNPWFAKASVLVAAVLMIVIRAPHGKRSREIKVVKSRLGLLEQVILVVAWLGSFPAVIWAVTPVPVFADHPLRPVAFIAGVLCLALGLWLFHRSHADLGRNWSITLEVREKHQLVTHGVYRRIRHPMYTGFLLYGLGQALVIPNWLAGPFYLVTFALLIALRMGREERMMLEEFGKDYEAYMARTKRLIPGIW
jgi:protein-S-isoprenylcysteine O-methyltransferase Ste14